MTGWLIDKPACTRLAQSRDPELWANRHVGADHQRHATPAHKPPWARAISSTGRIHPFTRSPTDEICAMTRGTDPALSSTTSSSKATQYLSIPSMTGWPVVVKTRRGCGFSANSRRAPKRLAPGALKLITDEPALTDSARFDVLLHAAPEQLAAPFDRLGPP